MFYPDFLCYTNDVTCSLQRRKMKISIQCSCGDVSFEHFLPVACLPANQTSASLLFSTKKSEGEENEKVTGR
jgi:hypothetical protein